MPQTLCCRGVGHTAKMQDYYEVENVRAISMPFENSLRLVLLTRPSDASSMVFVFSLGGGKLPMVKAQVFLFVALPENFVRTGIISVCSLP